jgi:ankyrin repeat protein
LQEVAAARHILIKCGSTEIDGHAFSVGLEVARQHLNRPAIPAAFLIHQAVFRSRQISRNDGRLSLDICSLGELVDMYHTHKAEIFHDKIYALLGMCSDPLRPLDEASLGPNYNLEWKILMQRLIAFLLGSKATVDTWNNKAMALIKSKGCILGKIVKVESNPSSGANSQCIEAIFKSTSPKDGTIWGWPIQRSVRWTLRASAKSIRHGDLICFLEGATEPTIVRLCKDYFTIIMIKAVLPERLVSENFLIQRSEFLRSALFTRDFFLVWDWDNFVEKSQSDFSIWMQNNSLKSQHSTIGFENRLYSVISNWNSVISQCSGEYGSAEIELSRIAEGYVEEEQSHMRSEAASELLLQLDKTEVGSINQYSHLLKYAAMRNHATTVRLLLGNGRTDINAKVSKNGQTMLSYVAMNGHEAVAKLLLENTADFNRKDDEGWTPLSWAADNEHISIVKLLLEVKADIDTKLIKGGRTSLSRAAANGKDALVKLLLEANADPNTTDHSHRTPLSWAAENGHAAVVKLLLEAKADPNTCDLDERRPLSLAAANGHEAVVKLLLKAKADVDVLDSFHRMPLSLAAVNGHEAVVELLLETDADVDTFDVGGRRPLSLAAANGHEVVVKLLLEAEADVNTFDFEARRPLSMAAANGHEGVVKLLLEAEAIVDSVDVEGRTALAWAATNEHEAVVKLLLEAGAAVDAKDY